MYIRENKTTNKKTGKVYVKHTLVESIRTDRGPRQRLVMTLGEITLPKVMWKALANALESYLYGESECKHLDAFGLPEELLEEIETQRIAINHKRLKMKDKANKSNTKKNIQEVDINSINVIESRSLGPELLANDTWDQLEFKKILTECGFSPKEIALSAAVIWGRLIAPGSDLSTWKWLRKQTSLPDFFDENIALIHKDHIYSIADKLLKHKTKLEAHLYQRQKDILKKDNTVFLFDLTNFYFEGKCENNKLAKRGKSKEKRSQNPLVTLALIVDSDGLPVKSKIYKGNIGEPATLKEILDECGLLDDKGDLFNYRPTLAMDRGIATKENLELIKKYGFPFTVIERASRTHLFKEEFAKLEGFKKIEDTKKQIIHLKKIGNKILCFSEAKGEKERAMRDKKIERTQKELDALIKSITSGSIKDPEKILVRIGKIKKGCSNFDKLFKLTYSENFKDLKYEQTQWNKELDGCYIIEYDNIQGSDEDIWRLYMTLNKVENAFRAMKTDLGTRPIYHQGEERTESHLFLSILAYHILRNIEIRLSNNGIDKRWATIKDCLSTHQRCKLTWNNSNGVTQFKYCSGIPEAEQINIYQTLKIKNPLKDYIFS